MKLILFLLTFLYVLVEYKYDQEIILFSAFFTTFIIIYNGVIFRSKEKNSIELGEKEDFRSSHLFVLCLLIALFLFLYYGLPKINELNLLPDLKREPKIWWIPLLILAPQLIEFLIAFLSSEMKVKYYATEVGLLKSLEAKEEIKWQDFYKFKIIDSQNIIRFQKKNLKYFFIKYDEEYFNEFKEDIISFLNKKLIRE